uniref:Uncharacterized protein n=1 Tax=Ascaris suum TaxID=6253 RepID=F1L233_ASCSU
MDESIVWIKEPSDTNAATTLTSNLNDAIPHTEQQQFVTWTRVDPSKPSPVVDHSTAPIVETNTYSICQNCEAKIQSKPQELPNIPPSTAVQFDDVKIDEKATSEQFDIANYERKLHEHTQQTLNLLSNLCNYSDRLKQQQKSILNRLHEEQIKRYQITEQMQKVMQANSELSTRRDQLENEVQSLKVATIELKKAAQKKAGIEWHNVDCVRIGECFLREPSSAIVLPDSNVFVSDSQLGLFLFSLNSDLIRNVSNVDWRWAQAATLLPDGHLLVSMMVRETSSLPWRRFIMKFDADLNFIAKVEGPKWIEDETILRERLCAASNGFIYFAVAGETFSALYELSPDAKWTELEHKRGQTFLDVQVLAVTGPVIELLLVEQRRGYLCLYSVRDSSIAVT